MKKTFKISFFIALIIFVSVFSITKVNAAYAYVWTVDGEGVNRGSSNKAGNATWEEDDNYTGGVLTLNNYNGGQLKIDCYGTGLGHIFAIKLVGDNNITVDKGIGILAAAPIVFIGDGKLTINAAMPIVHGSSANGNYKDGEIYGETTTLTIEPSITSNTENSSTIKEEDKNPDSREIEETTKDDNTDTKINSEENNSFLDSDLFKVIVLSYCVISLIIIVILIAKLKSKRKDIQ